MIWKNFSENTVVFLSIIWCKFQEFKLHGFREIKFFLRGLFFYAAPCILVTRVYLFVRGRMPTLPHRPRCNFVWMVEGAASCAVLGRFAIGAQVVLPWQRSMNVKRQWTSACIRCVPGFSYCSGGVREPTTLLLGVQWWMKKEWSQANGWRQRFVFPSMLWHCWLGDRKDIRPVKIPCHLSSTVLLNPVYTIQPVVKPVVQQVWQPAVSCKQTYNRLSTVLNDQHCSFNQLSNRVVQPVWQTRFDNRVEGTAVRSTACQIVFVKPVWQPVWQQVVSCKRGFTEQVNENQEELCDCPWSLEWLDSFLKRLCHVLSALHTLQSR